MSNNYNININAGVNEMDEPQISFTMDEDTATYLEEIASHNGITIGEFVAAILVE